MISASAHPDHYQRGGLAMLLEGQMELRRPATRCGQARGALQDQGDHSVQPV